MPGRDERDRFADLLSAYMDGELKPAEADRLERHLAGCQSCRSTLSELRQVSSLVHSLPAVAPTRSFVLTSLSPSGNGAPARSGGRAIVQSPAYRMLRGATALAAVALVVLVVANLTFGQGAPGTQLALAPAPKAEQQAPQSVPTALDWANAGQKSLAATAPAAAVGTAVPETGLATSAPVFATSVPSCVARAQSAAPGVMDAAPQPSVAPETASEKVAKGDTGELLSEQGVGEPKESSPVPTDLGIVANGPARQYAAGSSSSGLFWGEVALASVLVVLLIAIVSIRVSARRRS